MYFKVDKICYFQPDLFNPMKVSFFGDVLFYVDMVKVCYLVSLTRLALIPCRLLFFSDVLVSDFVTPDKLREQVKFWEIFHLMLVPPPPPHHDWSWFDPCPYLKRPVVGACLILYSVFLVNVDRLEQCVSLYDLRGFRSANEGTLLNHEDKIYRKTFTVWPLDCEVWNILTEILWNCLSVR